MTIMYYERWIPQLLTKFKVLKVLQEPHSESTWTLQYENYEPFEIYDKGFVTIEEDEKLVGKEILAHIDLSVEEILPTIKIEKNFSYNDGWLTTSGIYKDIILYKSYEEVYTSYKLDSVFPLEVSEIPEGSKIGDFITVQGEASLILPRKKDYITGLPEPTSILYEDNLHYFSK